MSELVMLGLAGTFGAALALFVATSLVALPFVAYDRIRAPARARRR
jgi:hypothetical protein